MALVTVKAKAFHQREVILNVQYDNQESAEIFRKHAELYHDLYGLKNKARQLPGYITSHVL